MGLLIDSGLMPSDQESRKALEKLDPYWLRKEALDSLIEPHELGRVLFHLNQRRGFKSNRIADSSADDKGATKVGIRALKQRIEAEGARTLGELLAHRHGRDRNGNRLEDKEIQPVRFRPETKGSKNLYEFYPTRAMLEDEIDEIWKRQKDHYPDLLTDDLLERIKRIIVSQRPLKAPVVGNCTFRPDEARAPKAHPLFQRFRIAQDVCQLRVVRAGGRERHLTLYEHEEIAKELLTKSTRILEFEKLRKVASLQDEERFNYERDGRKGFKTDEINSLLSSRKAFGSKWRTFDLEQQIIIVERLLEDSNEEVLSQWLRAEFELDEASAEHICNLSLPSGYARFGHSVLRELLEAMENETAEANDPITGEIFLRRLTYDEAAKSSGFNHSDFRPEKLRKKLPYYGEVLSRHVIQQPAAPEGSHEKIGRVPNPTVHIGLNQLRKVVNTLIGEYGRPDEIVIELSRDLKLSREEKERIQKQNRGNEKKRTEFRKKLEELKLDSTRDNFLRLRLYYELPAETRLCVYCGSQIGLKMLFDSSVEIDHVLPYSKTLDDSFSNKVLCCRGCNRQKQNRAPEHAWEEPKLNEIGVRAGELFPTKAWRFAPGAMERIDGDGGFLERQLTDTQHMSRLARTYLEQICKKVHATPGRLTAMLRGKWGLNGMLSHHASATGTKNRFDHRHHAVDAFVLACTSRDMLTKVSRASRKAEAAQFNRLFLPSEFPQPFDGYRDALAAKLASLVVSHRADHGRLPGKNYGPSVSSGQLLDSSAYGPIDRTLNGKHFNLARRRSIGSLTRPMIDRVSGDELRLDLQQVAYEASQLGEMGRLQKALEHYGEKHGVSRVRILETKKYTHLVKHGNGQFEKVYEKADNHCVEIYALPKAEWQGEGITTFDVNQTSFVPCWRRQFPKAKLIMRLHKGDLLEADLGHGQEIYRVYVLEPSAKRVRIALHHEAGPLDERHKDEDDPFERLLVSYKKLQVAQAKHVRVNPIGRVSYVEQEPC